MALAESVRVAAAITVAAGMGAVTVASAGGIDGLSSISAAATSTSTTTTLVPRPATTTSTTWEIAVPVLDDPATVPGTGGTRADGEVAPATTTTTTTAPPDPYAWLESIPVEGRTFIGISTQTGAVEEVADFEAATTVTPDAVMVSRSWAEGSTADIATIEAITAAGHLPILAWEPWDHRVESTFDRRRGEQPDFALSTIIAGDHDTIIEEWAVALAEWGRPVAIRFAHEMNGWWYPWSESSNGNVSGQYAAAWRHVHGVFENAGATNVIWIWSPNPTQPTLPALADLYPGDEYVDWLGLVGYLGNGIDPSVYVPTFDQLYGPTIEEMREFSDLPLVITEIGATEHGGKKAAWISHVFEAIDARDDIVGVVWFEVDKETDWRVTSSEAARVAFVEAVTNGAYGIPRN